MLKVVGKEIMEQYKIAGKKLKLGNTHKVYTWKL